MKRSKLITLALMGTSPFVLTACDAPKPAVVYSSVAECAKDGVLTREQCQTEYAKAIAMHPQVAPRYTSVADCEADFGAGRCQTVTPTTSSNGSSGNAIIPAMAGFMAAQALNQLSQRRHDDLDVIVVSSGYTPSFPSQPLYRSRDDRSSWRTSSNEVAASKPGKTAVSTGASRPSMTAATLSRGGFGSQAAARSSWGG